MIEELSMSLMLLSILFPISYIPVFRKKEWVSFFDEEEAKIMEGYENDGKLIVIYTFFGAVLRCIGIAGIVNFVVIFTADIMWAKLLDMMTLGMIWLFFGSEYGVALFCGVIVGVWYFRKIKGRIRSLL